MSFPHYFDRSFELNWSIRAANAGVMGPHPQERIAEVCDPSSLEQTKEQVHVLDPFKLLSVGADCIYILAAIHDSPVNQCISSSVKELANDRFMLTFYEYIPEVDGIRVHH